MTEAEKRQRRCCFTGHRPQKLRRSEREIKIELERAIRDAIANGYSTFITGMAYGVDIWAGEIVIRLREANPELHLRADLVKTICPSYNAGAYQRRNEWMVDHSAQVIAVFNGEKSGTKNTIDYAQKCGVQVEIIRA